jgi:hypothetical protein
VRGVERELHVLGRRARHVAEVLPVTGLGFAKYCPRVGGTILPPMKFS